MVSWQHLSALLTRPEDREVAERGLLWDTFTRPLSDIAQCAGSPTLWIGTEMAHTGCHQDTYGINLVAQLHGHKVSAPLQLSRTVQLPP